MDDISDDEILYRRLLPYYVKSDAAVSSSAYMRSHPSKGPDPEISVDAASLTTPEQTLAGHAGFELGVLKAGEVRKLGFTVRRDPMPDNAAHCIIEGVKTKEDCKRLAQITSVRPLPESPEPGA